MKILTKIEDFDPKKGYPQHRGNRQRPVYASETNYTCSCEFGYECDDVNFDPDNYIVEWVDIEEKQG